MAKAERTTITKTVEVEETVYALYLSLEELQAIASLVATCTPGVTSSIFNEVTDICGVNEYGRDYRITNENGNSIYSITLEKV